MTENSFRDSSGSSQLSENLCVVGGKSRSVGTNQSNSQSIAPKMRDIANIGVKAMGTMASICIPRMEGAETLSLNTPPVPPKNNDIQFSNDHNPQSNEVETNNIIANTISGSSFGINKN
ncbi:hypothetical protein ME1_00498 [Bartonella vinsonii subsp. arupensis OK-94-513]|uniref:Uncharacterized protein n=2 Tax=Bartonella vinsonii subsp. arupensis TaxID=110578 RepID=J0ZMK6_BARVI|nr:hypothetical protein [Bartonella vinsonii]EJF89728.1 hypothetical protein ME1_00498 [Bartonella vinsonii subsp. arupensis OK-94-513]EJF98383.1 hypothetical protein MEI_00882 [Bartonella vinsonii subsp. arupensis Pm136co]